MNTGEIILYQADNAIQPDVRVDDETVWLTQAQMVELFERDKSVISQHIKNIFDECELEKQATVAFFATVQNEDGRLVERLEYRVCETERKIDFFVKTALHPVEGVFYDSQIFDAYNFVSILKLTETEAVNEIFV